MSTPRHRSQACRSCSRITRGVRRASRTTPAWRTLRDLDYRPRTDSRLALRVRAGGLIPIGRTNVPELAAMGTTEPRSTVRRTTPGISAVRLAARRVVRQRRWRRGSCRPGTPPTSLARSASRRRCAGWSASADAGACVASADDPPIGMSSEGVVTRSVRARRRSSICSRGVRRGGRRRRCAARSLMKSMPGSVARGSASGPRHSTALLSTQRRRPPQPMPPTCSRRMGCSVDVSAPAVLSSDELWRRRRRRWRSPSPPTPRGGRNASGTRRRADLDPCSVGDGAGRAGDQRGGRRWH